MSDAPDSTVAQDLMRRAQDYGLALDANSLRVNEAGLDYRVGFANDTEGTAWVLRVPRRPDVSANLDEERRILAFVQPRLGVAVPAWRVCSPDLIAYPSLPGAPGLTLDAAGQPVWHFDPSSPEFATALGQLIARLHAINADDAGAAGVPARTAAEVRTGWRDDLARVQAAFEIAPAQLAAWQAWLDRDELWPDVVTLTHGELYAAHVLIDTPASIVGVLDWTTAKVGDPAIDFAYQHMMGSLAFETTVAAYEASGGAHHPRLAERCAALTAASPLVYALFALRTGTPAHRAQAAAMLNATP